MKQKKQLTESSLRTCLGKQMFVQFCSQDVLIGCNQLDIQKIIYFTTLKAVTSKTRFEFLILTKKIVSFLSSV